MHGHQDIRELLDSLLRATPHMTFNLLAGPYVIPGQPLASFHWRGRGTSTGRTDPPGFEPAGRLLGGRRRRLSRVPRRPDRQPQGRMRPDDGLRPARTNAGCREPGGTGDRRRAARSHASPARVPTTSEYRGLTRHPRQHRRASAFCEAGVMTLIAVAEMFGISGRRNDLAALLERFERWRRESGAAGATSPPRRLPIRVGSCS